MHKVLALRREKKCQINNLSFVFLKRGRDEGEEISYSETRKNQGLIDKYSQASTSLEFWDT